VRQLAAEYKDFPAYSATQNLLNAISASLPVLLLTHYFGLASGGAYAFGERLLSAPMGVVLNALRQVLFQRAAEMHHKGHALAPLFVNSTAALFGIGLLPVGIVALWAPQFFEWAFGGQWYVAGQFARYLAIWFFFVFCNVPAVLFARLIRIQRTLFFYNAAVLALRFGTLIFGGLYLTALQSIALFSLVGAFVNLALILLVGSAFAKREGLGVAQFRDAFKRFSYSHR
jgi:O-antigen/teichoic acid export membrane protein